MTAEQTSFKYERDTPTVISKYFKQPRILAQHQLESFNNAIETVIPSIINHQNPIQIPSKWNPKTGRFDQMYEITITNVYLCRPLIRDNHETIKPLLPHEARLRNLTYAAPLFIDIEHKMIDLTTANKPIIGETIIDAKIPLCNFPIMLQSKYCHLSEVNQYDLQQLGENIYDIGGYFIINGSEKVIIPQERPAENRVLCFQQKGEIDKVEIKSTVDQRFSPVNTVAVILNKPKDSESDRLMTVRMRSVKDPVNLFVVFRALGVQNDQEIFQMILGLDHNLTQTSVHDEDLNRLLPTAFEIFTEKELRNNKLVNIKIQITNQIEALKYLARRMEIKREYAKDTMSKDVEMQTNYELKYVKEMLARDFLPHMGRDFQDKAMFLGYMVRRLLDSVRGNRPYDDRDNYANKRLDLSGMLLMQIFRENYTKMIREIKAKLTSTMEASNLSSISTNLRKLIQTSKIDSSLKYALSTGDWSSGRGSKQISTKIGIAQVLSRLSLAGSISYLRRLQSPLEKEGGKMVAPRRLHGTQIGRICPNETPEGQQVGVVKNLALSAKISLDVSAGAVYLILKSLNLITLKDIAMASLSSPQAEEKSSERSSERTSERTSEQEIEHVTLGYNILDYTVKVFVNGRWAGNARDIYHSQNIYQNLLYYKRSRNPDLGLSWNYEYREIHIRSDGGRYLRPLYIVNYHDKSNKLALAERWAMLKDLTWKQLLFQGAQAKPPEPIKSLLTSDLRKTEGAVIEYLDVEEEENAMVAVSPKALNTHADVFLRFTHCEIHPSLWLGVISSVIPFSDHNQSPRNCYQCLWINEEVRMADGTLKKIAEIRLGDQVITVDPKTLKQTSATVINHYVKSTDKNIVKITTRSGASLVCTDDHPVLTVGGKWIQAKNLSGLSVCTFSTDQQQSIGHQPNDQKHKSAVFDPIVSIDPHPNVEIADISIDAQSHSFITGQGICVHNSSMGKQALGIYATNYNQRMDTGSAHVLCYPQKPLVNSAYSKYFGLDNCPHGQQLMVAIACFTGYNQEDSVMMNRSAVQQGLLNSLYFKTHVARLNSRKHSTNEKEHFGLPPNAEQTRHLKVSSRRKNTETDSLSSYRYCDQQGIVREGTRFDNLSPEEEIVIVAKYVTTKPKMPTSTTHDYRYQDISLTIQPEEGTTIDRVLGPNDYISNRDADGEQFIKVREVTLRKPEIGDKVASRSAQKGTIGMLYRREEMPFTSNGLIPDLIINPHCIPSRMTMAQVIECLISKVAVQDAKFVDSTAFTNPSASANSVNDDEFDMDDPLKYYTERLKDLGLHEKGEEVMFNPMTGEQFKSTIFFGPTYYQRLKHMVKDKWHARETGPVKTTTRQPSDGRSRDGGLRAGYRVAPVEYKTNFCLDKNSASPSAWGNTFKFRESPVGRSSTKPIWVTSRRLRGKLAGMVTILNLGKILSQASQFYRIGKKVQRLDVCGLK